MYYSKQLLSRFISGTVDTDKLADVLTMKTCEVEQIHQRVIPEHVVIGRVVSMHKHPNADKLTICQLDCGFQGNYQICTGADNIRADIYVPVALPGCFLPAINLKIEPREMRGEPSNGMICSKEELGIGEDLDLHGIRILQDVSEHKKSQERQISGDMQTLSDRDLGKTLGEIAPWLNNRILEVDNKTITHRPDLFGHLGLAFEYQALFPKHISFSTLPALQEQLDPFSIMNVLSHATPPSIALQVESPYVAAYTLLEISGSRVQESPLRLRLQLLDLEQQPKNNRVDFGNYFMFLTGQPIHCFDADCVDGAVIVRQARAGELLVDLFDKEHTLTEDDIVIADQSKILALAGLIGGKSSGITPSTERVLIEIAHFDPVVIRKTALRIGLRTEAQTRFEKSPNPIFSLGATLLCLDELNFLGKDLFGDRSCDGVAVVMSPGMENYKKIRVDVDMQVLRTLLGCGEEELSHDEVKSICTNLGCVFQGDDKLLVPIRRGVDDIHYPIDIAEEVARIYGYDKIGNAPYSVPMKTTQFIDTIQLQRRCEQLRSASYRYDQIETYPWIDQRWHELFVVSQKTCLQMENPLAPELVFLRPTIVPSLLEAIEKNAPVYDEIRLYDIGKIWSTADTGKEQTVLGVALMKGDNKRWDESVFLDLKGKVTDMIQQLLPDKTIIFEKTDFSRAHSLQQISVSIDHQQVGQIATIHPMVKDMLGRNADQNIAVAEIFLSTIEQLSTGQPPELGVYETLQDQILRRELSFSILQTATYGSVVDALKVIPEIDTVEVTDLYTGGQIEAGTKSITVRFKLKGDGTRTTDRIQTIMQKAIQQVQATGATLRGG